MSHAGTTWTQEIMYLVHSNLDFSTAKSKDLNERFPYVEHARTEYDFVKKMPSPRLLKSHLPYSLLPPDIHKKQCKVIYAHLTYVHILNNIAEIKMSTQFRFCSS